MFYQAEFNSSEDYPERKLVFSVYCNQPIQSLAAVSLQGYEPHNIETLEFAL